MPRHSMIRLCCLAVGLLWPIGPETRLMAADPPVFEARPGGPTIAEAIAAARGEAGRPRRVAIRAGDWFLDEPITLGPEDSGLIIEGEPETVIHGGRRIEGWRQLDDGLWAAELPEVREGSWDFRMLVVNGRTAERARLPADGFFECLNTWTVPWMSTTGGGWQRKPTTAELTTLQYRPDDLGDWLDVRNAEITVYHLWDESQVGVAANHTADHTLTLSSPCGHPPGAFGSRRYVVWNVREGLTRPGQWYLDRTYGRVVYRPLPGEDPQTLRAVAPTTTRVFQVAGRAEQPVRDVTLRGLTVTVTGTPLVAGGFGAGRFDGAIHLTNVEGCTVERVEVRNVGGQGIVVGRSTGTTVRGCHVHHTGAGGILTHQGGALVENNLVHDVGLAYPSAIAVWGGGKDGAVCRIVHNTIHHTSYTAIACGGDDHVIEANRIHHAMEVLHDGAAIYITFCKRVAVRGNWVHDIPAPERGQRHAYYLDEQAEDCLVEGNLAVRVGSPSHNHMARGNILRHNVFVSDADLTCHFPKCEGYRLERNVMVAAGKIRLRGPEAVAQFVGNVLHGTTVEAVPLAGYTGGQAAPLAESSGISLADPLLDLAVDGWVRFRAGSPAPALGIGELDVREAGCRDPALEP